MRSVFFFVNFTGAILGLMSCAWCVAQAESFGSYFGAWLFFLPCVGLAIAEWLLWHRQERNWEGHLGVVFLVLGAFHLFGVVTSVYEALAKSWPDGFGLVLAGWSVVAAYCFACGAYRLRLGRQLGDLIARGSSNT